VLTLLQEFIHSAIEGTRSKNGEGENAHEILVKKLKEENNTSKSKRI
jgi:hypothetical protein